MLALWSSRVQTATANRSPREEPMKVLEFSDVVRGRHPPEPPPEKLGKYFAKNRVGKDAVALLGS